MAEYVMKDIVKKRGIGDNFEIASAATSTEEIGSEVYPPARKTLYDHGIRCDGKRSRQMTMEDYLYYDYIIAMDRHNLRNMVRFIGDDPEGKVSMLLPHDVADPWYTRDFDQTWDDVNEGCNILLERLGFN
jgi:protein-tyrosine phosphatase